MAWEHPSSFGNLLRRFRREAGLTQRELAELAGLSFRTVSDLERGINATPRRDSAAMLADALGLEARERSDFFAAARRRLPGATIRIPAEARLPRPTMPLVGRAAELAAVVAQLRHPATWLLTIVGPGGVGKTRLAIEAATAVGDVFPDGAALVRLGTLSDPALVLPAVAAALGVAARAEERDLSRAIAARLASASCLVVLDNLEHLLDAADDLAALVRQASGLVVLVTSREALHIEDERIRPLAPLPPLAPETRTAHAALPDPHPDPAVALFLQHAVRVQPTLPLDPDTPAGRTNREIAAHVCSLLDGLPLAIELAAAQLEALRLPSLPAAIREAGLTMLASQRRDRPGRLRTMDSAIAWSHHLLDDEEQRIFRRMAVCAGGFDLRAAAALMFETPPPVDPSRPPPHLPTLVSRLSSLVHRHLLVPEPPPDPEAPPRYRMLEPIRLFALDRLREAGEEALMRQRHAHYFAVLAERLDLLSLGFGTTTWLGRLAAGLPNFRAAHDWATATADGDAAGRIATSIAQLLWFQGMTAEAEARLAAARAVEGSQPARLRWLLRYWQGALAILRSDGAEAERVVREMESLAHAEDDTFMRGGALGLGSQTLGLLGRHEEALERADQAVAFLTPFGDPTWLSWVLSRRGIELQALGQAETAREAHEAAIDLRRRSGCEIYRACSLICLGSVSLDLNDPAASGAVYVSGLEIAIRIGDAWRIFILLMGLAELALAIGSFETALTLFGAAQTWRRRFGFASSDDRITAIERWLDPIEHELGDDAAALAKLRGDELTDAELIAMARSLGDAASRRPPGARCPPSRLFRMTGAPE